MRSNRPVTVYLTKEQYAALRQTSDRTMIPMTRLIIKALQLYLEAHHGVDPDRSSGSN
jgi:hypothetical protein